MFYFLGLILILIGTFVTYKASSYESEKTIKDLKDSLNIKNEELQTKQDALINKQKVNTKLSEKILQLQEKLDSNTNAIADVSDEISKVSKKKQIKFQVL